MNIFPTKSQVWPRSLIINPFFHLCYCDLLVCTNASIGDNSVTQLHASYTMGCEAENLNFLVPLVPICSENLWAGNGISGAKNTPTSPVLSCGLSRPLPYLYRPLTVFTKLKIPFMFHCFFFSFNFSQSIWFAHLGDAKHGGTQPPHTLLLWSDPYMVFIVIVYNHSLL